MGLSTPHYVTAGLTVLDGLYAERFEGGAHAYPRTGSNGGLPIITEVFEMRSYCWCDGQAEGHDGACPPNFLHRASGLELSWYKHAERGQTCSFTPSAEQWAGILTECIEAVLALPQPYRVLITGSREYGAALFERGHRLHTDWMSRPSPQRDAMVSSLRSARARAGARPLVVVHGGAKGADTLAGLLAERSAHTTEIWPALWRREDGSTRGGYDRAEALRVQHVFTKPGEPYYKPAGFERNQAMVDAGADECLAFLALGAGNRGTKGCIAVAQKAGIPVTLTEA